MPAAHAKAIVTTTLAIILGTNLLMAPITAPLIAAMRLKSTSIGPSMSALVLPLIAQGSEPRDEDAVSSAPAPSSGGVRPLLSRTFPGAAPLSAQTVTPERSGGPAGAASMPKAKPEMNPVHRAWRILDQHYMKPLFGGRLDRDNRGEDEMLDLRGLSRGGRVLPADSSSHGGVQTIAMRNNDGSFPPVPIDSPPPAGPP
eukprot:scaffold11917_cov128-Isochrysis_galbana.AAC.6